MTSLRLLANITNGYATSPLPSSFLLNTGILADTVDIVAGARVIFHRKPCCGYATFSAAAKAYY
jgi:hypothetical protein